MSEFSHHYPESIDPPELATVQNITETFQDWTENPTGGDKYIQAFGSAAVWLLQNHDDFRASIVTMLEFRQESPDSHSSLVTQIKTPAARAKGSLTKEHAANLILRSVQHELLKIKDEINYPIDFLNASKWIVAIDDIYKDPREFDDLGNTRRDSLDVNLSWRVVQTNIPERYKGVKLAYAYYKEIFDGPVNALEVGSSLQTGWTKLIVGDHFKNLDVISYDDSGLRVKDEAASRTVNLAINGNMPVGYVVGNDLFHPRDRDTQSWVRSQFRPSEYLKPTELEKFDRYVEASYMLPNQAFIRGDFSDSKTCQNIQNELMRISEKSTTKFDMLTVITTIYEGTPAEIKGVIENGAELLKDDGVMIIQEPLVVDPYAPHGMKFLDNFRVPGAYKTVAVRPHKDGFKPVVLASYSDGRCTAAEIPSEVIEKISR